MKKLVVLFLSFSLVLATIIPTYASSTLTDEQKEQLYDAGYPYSYRSRIDDWYETFQDVIGDPFHFGSFSSFGAFSIFVTNMAEANDPDDLNDFAVVARGVFDEVANESNKVTNVKYIYDCLTNRVKNYSSTWSNYLEASQKWGLNSLNPNMSEYWLSMNVRTPIESASGNQAAMEALINSYAIAWDKFQMGSQPVSNPHFKLITNSYALPDKYTYFDKSSSGSYAPLLRGSFYYHPNDK